MSLDFGEERQEPLIYGDHGFLNNTIYSIHGLAKKNYIARHTNA